MPSISRFARRPKPDGAIITHEIEMRRNSAQTSLIVGLLGEVQSINELRHYNRLWRAYQYSKKFLTTILDSPRSRRRLECTAIGRPCGSIRSCTPSANSSIA